MVSDGNARRKKKEPFICVQGRPRMDPQVPEVGVREQEGKYNREEDGREQRYVIRERQ